MKKKQCPKCKRILPIYSFGMRKQKRWIKAIKAFRTYYHTQSYCYECRHPHTDIPKPIKSWDENE